MTARYVRSHLLPLGGWCAKMSDHGRKASLELSADMVDWGFSSFRGDRKGSRRWQNCVGRVHSGESASPGLLRCLLLNSRGDPKLLDHGSENYLRTLGTSSRRPSISRKEEGTLGF